MFGVERSSRKCVVDGIKGKPWRYCLVHKEKVCCLIIGNTNNGRGDPCWQACFIFFARVRSRCHYNNYNNKDIIGAFQCHVKGGNQGSPSTNSFSSPSRGFEPGSSAFKSPTLTTEPRCLPVMGTWQTWSKWLHVKTKLNSIEHVRKI